MQDILDPCYRLSAKTRSRFIIISSNFCVFCFCTLSNKLDLIEATCFILTPSIRVLIKLTFSKLYLIFLLLGRSGIGVIINWPVVDIIKLSSL
jgi:hypothetical protein